MNLRFWLPVWSLSSVLAYYCPHYCPWNSCIGDLLIWLACMIIVEVSIKREKTE